MRTSGGISGLGTSLCGESSLCSIWLCLSGDIYRRQLDFEAAAREEDRHRGLGCFEGAATYTSHADRVTTFPGQWHSGKVEFKVRIISVKREKKGKNEVKKPEYFTAKFIFLKPKLGRSCQFSRAVGSEDCLILKPSGDGFTENEQEFLAAHTLVIMSKHFHLFCGKQDNAYMGSFSVKEHKYGSSSMFSFDSAIKVFNNYDFNGDQASMHV